MNSFNFEDLRPYRDEEINAAMRRLTQNPNFVPLTSYIYPERTHGEIVDMFHNINTIYEFQSRFMHDATDRIISLSVDELSHSGMENIDAAKSYLYVSNHRDITLDATLLQYVLFNEGHPTSEITFGDNLMRDQFVTDLGRSNKMFKLMRGGTPRELLNNSRHLSFYIRDVITRRGESLWIAQRNGRTKDGNDVTEQGIVKMFNMSGGGDVAHNIAELRIVPVAVSYQWETCDSMKAREIVLSRSGRYVKAPGEDLVSILTGIQEPKGNIHISICKPLCLAELEEFSALEKNDVFAAIAALVDRRIYASYRLWDTNFIAHDMLHGADTCRSHYTDEAKARFVARMEKKLSALDIPPQGDVRDIFLSIYARPVDNCFFGA